MAREYTIEADGGLYYREVGQKSLILNPHEVVNRLMQKEKVMINCGMIDTDGNGHALYMQAGTNNNQEVALTAKELKIRYPWVIDGDIMKAVRMDRGTLGVWLKKNPAPPVMEIMAPEGGYWIHYLSRYPSEGYTTYCVFCAVPIKKGEPAMQLYRPPVDNVREDGAACTGHGVRSTPAIVQNLRSFMDTFSTNVANTDHYNNCAEQVRFRKVDGKWVHVPFTEDDVRNWMVASSVYARTVMMMMNIKSTEVR